MTRTRILSFCFLLLLVAVPVACQSTTTAPVTQQPVAQHATPAPSAAVNVVTCKMFALGDLAEDASYAKWIVETIPNVIQPGTWDQKKGAAENRTLSYHAPAKVLVVYHTPAVHAKVDEFLKDLKKATAVKGKKPAAIDPAVQQTQFVPAPSVPPTTPGYPVALPLQQPKHLFHFIIRYEGDGIVDSNVVKFATALATAAKSEATGSFTSRTPMVCEQIPGPIVGTGWTPANLPPQYLTPPPPPPFAGVPVPSAPPPARTKMPPAESETKTPSGL